jgi:hypothetical protein
VARQKKFNDIFPMLMTLSGLPHDVVNIQFGTAFEVISSADFRRIAACVDGSTVRWELVISRGVALGAARLASIGVLQCHAGSRQSGNKPPRAGSFRDYLGAGLIFVARIRLRLIDVAFSK